MSPYIVSYLLKKKAFDVFPDEVNFRNLEVMFRSHEEMEDANKTIHKTMKSSADACQNE
jgi:hypothetical protein